MTDAKEMKNLNPRNKSREPNATDLTEKYPGKEKELWTPCIYEFFRRHKPELPVSACIANFTSVGPWYKSRERKPNVRIEGEILPEPTLDDFLPPIDEMFERDLKSDPELFRLPGRDVAGIRPDILVIRSNRQGVYVIENKPYYESVFDGNQGPGHDYAEFVKRLNKNGIPCEYLIIHSISWKKGFSDLNQLQDELPDYFGSLLLEDIFGLMHQHKFTFPGISESFGDYSKKGNDFDYARRV